MKSRFLKLLCSVALALATIAPLPAPLIEQAHAAATTQTTHSYLCAPIQTAGPQARHVVNTASTASPQPSYNLNSAGCAVIAGADIGFFLSQGYYYGPALFSAQATGIAGGASGTASEATNITLPAYGLIVGIVVCETAGNAITGGLSIGDSGSGTRFISGSNLAVGANACVTAADASLTRLYAPSGVPTSDALLVAAATSWNSASVNITVLYTYY